MGRRDSGRVRATLVAFTVSALVTSSAGAADACAWMLWLQETQKDGIHALPGNPQPWMLRETYESLADCRGGMKKQIADLEGAILSTQPGTAVKAFESSVMILVGGGRHITEEFKCLPDTIDPRAPKGTR